MPRVGVNIWNACRTAPVAHCIILESSRQMHQKRQTGHCQIWLMLTICQIQPLTAAEPVIQGIAVKTLWYWVLIPCAWCFTSQSVLTYMFGSGFDIGSMIQQQPHHPLITLFGRLMQSSWALQTCSHRYHHVLALDLSRQDHFCCALKDKQGFRCASCLTLHAMFPYAIALTSC